MAFEPKPDVFEIVHEAFDRDTTHALARKVVEAVLDVHHEFKGCCYDCSRRVLTANFPSVTFPCTTVKVILGTVKEG